MSVTEEGKIIKTTLEVLTVYFEKKLLAKSFSKILF